MIVNQSFFYIINYKPLINYKKKLKSLNVIYCKNFFLFFLLLDYIKQNKVVKLSISKKSYYFNSFLRAPNKYKKAQIKINLVRYKIMLKFFHSYELSKFIKISLNDLVYFLNFFF